MNKKVSVIADAGFSHEGHLPAMLALANLAAEAGADGFVLSWTSDAKEACEFVGRMDDEPYYNWIRFQPSWHGIVAGRCKALGISYAAIPVTDNDAVALGVLGVPAYDKMGETFDANLSDDLLSGATAVRAGATVIRRLVRLETAWPRVPAYATSMGMHGFTAYVRHVREAELVVKVPVVVQQSSRPKAGTVTPAKPVVADKAVAVDRSPLTD